MITRQAVKDITHFQVLYWNNAIPRVYIDRITTTSVSFYIFPIYMDTFQALNNNQLDPRYKAVATSQKTEETRLNGGRNPPPLVGIELTYLPKNTCPYLHSEQKCLP